jgi:ABC-type multidrug transport system ATPase subunit
MASTPELENHAQLIHQGSTHKRIHEVVVELGETPAPAFGSMMMAGATLSEAVGTRPLVAPEDMVAEDQKLDFERAQTQKDIARLPSSPSNEVPQYIQFLLKLRDSWKDCPDVHLQFVNIGYKVQIPVRDTGIRNFLQTGLDGLKQLDFLGKINKSWGPKKKDFTVLAPMSGRIRPATMTLLLTPPGHGKTTFLKALAGRLEGDKHFGGKVLFNGLTKSEANAKSVFVHRMVSYIGQTDIHFPALTVRETFDFAAKNAVPDITTLTNDTELIKMDQTRPQLLLDMLGLSECAETIIGSDLIRGVSGGQRRRSTIGEMLITNARVIMMDEVSTGLDAAVTYHIFHALQQWSHLCNGSIVTALLQPTPEVYGLFDDIMLMREGEMIYHGPRSGVRDFFADDLHLPIPDDVDEAGFVVDYLNDPKSVLHRIKKRVQKSRLRAAG